MNKAFNQQDFSLGIDVGKEDLFSHLIGNNESFSAIFKNTAEGIKRLITWVNKMVGNATVHTCMEATGHYTRLASQTLAKAFNGQIYVTNPRQIKAFATRRLRRNKSDKADAKLIAQFLIAEKHELTEFIPKSKGVATLVRNFGRVFLQMLKQADNCFGRKRVQNPAGIHFRNNLADFRKTHGDQRASTA